MIKIDVSLDHFQEIDHRKDHHISKIEFMEDHLVSLETLNIGDLSQDFQNAIQA